MDMSGLIGVLREVIVDLEEKLSQEQGFLLY